MQEYDIFQSFFPFECFSGQVGLLYVSPMSVSTDDLLIYGTPQMILFKW